MGEDLRVGQAQGSSCTSESGFKRKKRGLLLSGFDWGREGLAKASWREGLIKRKKKGFLKAGLSLQRSRRRRGTVALKMGVWGLRLCQHQSRRVPVWCSPTQLLWWRRIGFQGFPRSLLWGLWTWQASR